MKMKNNKNLPYTYNTSDLNIAAALRANGFKLTDVIISANSKKAIFSFDTSTSTYDPCDMVDDYYENRLTVDARTFVNAIDELKTRLYAKKR